MFINQVCDALELAKVPYAIVGGWAVALHGAPRGTIDIDIVIKWSLINLQKTEESFKKLGLVSRIPVNAENIFLFHEEYLKNRNLIAWNFYDPVKPINQVDIIITYDLESGHSQTIRTSKGNIKILSKKDLIRMKKTAGRPQDLEDVKALEAL